MTLVKWTPNRNMFNIFDDVESMVNQAFGDSLNGIKNSYPVAPLINVNETDNAYRISIDLPGVEKKDLEVNYIEGILSIIGERKSKDEGRDENSIRNEAASGSFNISYELSGEVVEDKIKAKFKNGVLTLKISKREQVKPIINKIAIS